MATVKGSAQLAYEAFCNTCGYKHPHNGKPMPRWHEVDMATRKAFEAAAKAVQIVTMEAMITRTQEIIKTVKGH